MLDQRETPVIEVRELVKRFGAVTALDGVTLRLPRSSIVGLLGRNGSGKTTLLRTLVGLSLPSAGSVLTLGRPAGELGPGELARIGYLPQEIRLLDWMSVEQQIRYVATFYDRWDRQLEARLRRDLELSAEVRVGALSVGNLQRLALLLALCHRPRLLLLDEPVSDLDPIARARLLELLLELVAQEETTVVISSHVLHDVERVVDRVVCLDAGRVTADDDLDALRERYAQWLVVGRNGRLPQRFDEPFVLTQQIDGRQARLLVDLAVGEAAGADGQAFAARHGVEVTSRPLNLEALFPLLIGEVEP